MSFNLRNRSFLKELDFTPKELKFLLDLSLDLKKARYAGTEQQRLKGKNIALIFEKDSTRTRCAFEVAAYDQGAHVTYLGPTGSQMGKKETIQDTARVLGRMYDGIEYRGFGQEIVEELAKHAGVPVWNGLTNEFHPTQLLADFLTFMEHTDKPLSALKFAYLGDARFNMGNSYLIGSAKLGLDFRIVAPKSLYPNADLVKEAKAIAKTTGAKITLTDSVDAGRQGLRLHRHRRLGLDGRARRRLAGADQAPEAVPGHLGRDEEDRQSECEVPALPAVVPQPRNDDRRGDLREVRSRVRWRSPTTSSSPTPRWSGTRPKTASTRSKP